MNDETTITPIPDPAPPRPAPPPLRIHHILAATASVAVLLAVAKWLKHNYHPGLAGFLESGASILSIVSTGLAATLVGFGIAWRRQGHAFFHQPGHWLLLLATFPAVLYAMFGAATVLRLAGWEEYEQWPIALYGLVLYVGWLALNLRPPGKEPIPAGGAGFLLFRV